MNAKLTFTPQISPTHIIRVTPIDPRQAQPEPPTHTVFCYTFADQRIHTQQQQQHHYPNPELATTRTGQNLSITDNNRVTKGDDMCLQRSMLSRDENTQYDIFIVLHSIIEFKRLFIHSTIIGWIGPGDEKLAIFPFNFSQENIIFAVP